MSNSFYLTLPSHSSKNEFPSNTSNHFKIRLPNPIRLEGSGWKVALSSISLPDPKNVVPHWLTETEGLLYNSWYHTRWGRNVRFLSDNFKISNVSDTLDLNNMTGVDFMKNAVDWLNKRQIEKNMRPDWDIGRTDAAGKQHDYHLSYRFEGEDMVIDGSKVEYHDFGQTFSWYSPAFTLRIDLALEMGWFKRKNPPPSDPRLGLELGPNLVLEVRGDKIPIPNDLKCKWSKDGTPSDRTLIETFWFIQRLSDGSLSNYVQMSTNVNWRFINLNQSFKNVLGATERSLHVYSDAGSSSVVGNQITDLLREVAYKRQGRGSYYFEPTHPQYIGVRKDVIDIIETQVSETDGKLVNFGKGNTILTLHFKKD